MNADRHDGTVRTASCYVENGSDGSESGYYSDCSSLGDFRPVAEFYVDVKTLQAATSNSLHSPRVLNSLVSTAGTLMMMAAVVVVVLMMLVVAAMVVMLVVVVMVVVVVVVVVMLMMLVPRETAAV